MTQRLAKKLVEDGYKYIMRLGEIEFGVTKAEPIAATDYGFEFDGDTDFDCYECYKNETVKDLTRGTVYKLEDLVDKE